MSSVRRALRALLPVVLVVTAAGCAEAPRGPAEQPINVTGTAGEPPIIDFTPPLAVPAPRTEVVWPGTGPRLVEGGPVLLNIYAQSGRDRTVLQNTFTDAPVWYAMTNQSLGRLRDCLRGQRVGARVLYVEQDGKVPVIAVVDVLPTRANGKTVAPVAGLPTVTRSNTGAPTIGVPKQAAPVDLAVQTLIRGTGPQVEVGHVVTVRFAGLAWSTGKPMDENWTAGKAPMSFMIGIGEVNDGWDQGLVEQTVGSQVLLVVPPSLGYGGTKSALANETLIYVVDILDTHAPVQEESEDAGDAGASTTEPATPAAASTGG